MPEQLIRFLKSKSLYAILASVAFNLLALDIVSQDGAVVVSAVSTGAVVLSIGGEWVADAMRAMGWLCEASE